MQSLGERGPDDAGPCEKVPVDFASFGSVHGMPYCSQFEALE